MTGKRKLVLLVFLALAAPAAPPPAARAANLEAKPSSAAHLPVDEEVSDEIAEIDKLIRKSEWRKAIEVCQKFIAKPPKTVVEIRKGVYGSARALCEMKLSAMPEPAKLLYRTLHDPAAEELLRRAVTDRSLGDAQKLVAEFALTSHGPSGMTALADLLFEKGDARAALDYWMRWTAAADTKAENEAIRRRIAVKMALAAARLGDKAALDQAVELFGERGALIEAGTERIARAEELRKFTAGRWLKAGRPGPAAPETLDFKRWSTPGDDKYVTQIARYYGSSTGSTFSCYGQVIGGIFYMNAPDGVRAIDALTGRPIWQQSARNYDSDYYYALRSYNFHCRVYPAAGREGKRTVFVSGGSRLGAHDAGSGNALWSKSRASFHAIEAIGNNADLRVSFSSPVLCRRRSAYVILETSQGQVYLVALDRRTGALLWASGVGGSAPQSGYRMSFPSALLSVGSDIVFCNGRGVIGKCDAATGEVRWLLPYRRREQIAKGRSHYNLGNVRYFPLVRAGDSVICMPSDGQQILSVRVSDGRLNWEKEIEADCSLFGGAPATEDRKAGRLFVGGKDVRCLDADTGSVVWSWPVPDGSAAGLGRVTEKRVIVATCKGIYELSGETGELTGFRPVALPGWDDVHVASDGDSLVLTSNNGICAVGGKERTGELLRAAPPNGSGPWSLAMQAQLSQSKGRTEEALRLYSEAVKMAKRRSDTAKLAASLQVKVIDLFHDRQETEWRAGRPVEAFRWMRQALRSPDRMPYECVLGYPSRGALSPSEPHTVVMASGDRVSGRLTGVGGGTVTLLVRGEPWRILAAGVKRIIIDQAAGPEDRSGPRGRHIVLANGDRISCSVESLDDGRLTARASFGDLKLKLADVAAVVLDGIAPKLPPDSVHITLRNGDRLSGRVCAFDGARLVIETPSCGRRAISIENIRSVSNRRAMPQSMAVRRRLNIRHAALEAGQ
ncbi:MAG: PQQ-binding-like beta-propeller repeat protein [Planctomycetota bacterium]